MENGFIVPIPIYTALCLVVNEVIDMPVHIPWNQHEVALLIEAYLRVAEGADLRHTASQLSLTLRRIALQSGQRIDATYRNVNGMVMQLACVQYLFKNGEKGLSGASTMIRQMYKLYKADPSAYQSVLKEAIQMIGNAAMSVEDAFFAYAKGKIGLPPRMLSEYLKKAADYCHLKQPLLGMTDVMAVRNVQQKVSESKLLRFQYGKDAQAIRNVTLLYYNFIKSYREPKEKRPVPQALTEETVAPVQSDVFMDVTMAVGTSEPQEEVVSTKQNQLKAPSKDTASSPIVDGSISLEAFKRFLTTEQGFADRTARNYWTSIRMIEAYIQRNQLGFSLLDTDASGAQRIFDVLMSRPDFEQINIQRHRQFSAALIQYVLFLHQGGTTASVGGRKQTAQKTITETVFEVLRHAGEPLTVSEIYQAIVRDNLYPFGAQNPISVVYSKVSLACKQTEMRIRDGKDVLIKIEEDGRKKFQIMTAERATAYLKTQQSESGLAKASAWPEYEAVLKQAFPRGFQKESGLDMRKLRKRWAEIQGEELKDSDKTVHQQLDAHCVDTGKRWYLAELLLSNDDRQIVLQYIDRVLGSGKSVLYYSSIYTALEHQLESTVLTEDLLVRYLNATCKERYILQDHYLTNDRGAKIDLVDEIKDVMLAHGRPIHTDELKRVLHHLPPDQVERELHVHSEFIMDAFHMYFHESMADLTEQELNQIAAFIQEELDDQGYMIGDWIQRKLTQLYPETAERLSFLTLLGVRGAVAYKLRDRFTFSGPVVTPKGQEMNMIDVFAMFCQHRAPFTLDELAAFAKKCDSTIYLDTVHRNCVRVSETEFVPTGAVRWDIPHVDAAIALHCPGKYVSLKSIQYFDAFPYVGYHWNSYLLEQYVATVSKDFMLMHSSYAKSNTSGAIVRKGAGFEAFDDVLADILANAQVELESKACLEHLANAGYITRRKLSNINEIITRAKMLRSQEG